MPSSKTVKVTSLISILYSQFTTSSAFINRNNNGSTIAHSLSFHLCSQRPQRGTHLLHTTKNPPHCLFQSSNNDQDPDSLSEGEALSREFSRQVKLRGLRSPVSPRLGNSLFDDDDDEDESSSTTSSLPLASEEEVRRATRQPFATRREVRGGRDVPKTGRDKIMEQEFSLVSRAGNQQSIAIQAGLALVVLAFFVYVGFTGGITDGSERFAGIDWDSFDAVGDFGVEGGTEESAVWL